MAAAHTPGPWTSPGGIFVFTEDGPTRYVAMALHSAHDISQGMTEEERGANATLIAAVPDLLSIAQRWAALDAGDWHAVRHANEKAQLLADTRAAIAKATGSAS